MIRIITIELNKNEEITEALEMLILKVTKLDEEEIENIIDKTDFEEEYYHCLDEVEMGTEDEKYEADIKIKDIKTKVKDSIIKDIERLITLIRNNIDIQIKVHDKIWIQTGGICFDDEPTEAYKIIDRLKKYNLKGIKII